MRKGILFLLLSILILPVSGYGADEKDAGAKEEVKAEDEEKPIPAPDRPGFFLDKNGEVVDEFGLIVRLSESKDVCIRCHYNDEKYEELVLKWDNSRHSKNKVTCVKCHGGNPDGMNIKQAKESITKYRLVDRDALKSQGETLYAIVFDYCGQCHGTIYRDWKWGVHGKRTGQWNGEKKYRACVRCHNPHNPKYQPLQPEPHPVNPSDIKFNKSADKIQKDKTLKDRAHDWANLDRE